MTDSVLPHNLEAEKAVLGAILIQNANLVALGATLTPADFYRDAHRRIYSHMLALVKRNEPVDLVTLRESLMRAGELDECGGPAYIAALTDGVPRSANVEHYAGIVADGRTRRDLIRVTNDIMMAAYEGRDSTRDILDAAERQMMGLGSTRHRTALEPLADIVQREWPAIEDQINKGEQITGERTGFSRLDQLTGGLKGGNLIVLAARPSMGKTSFVVNVAAFAGKQGKTVAFFSLEMSSKELLVRYLSAQAQISAPQMLRGLLSETSYFRLGQAMCDAGESKIYVDDGSDLSVWELRSKCRALKQSVGLDVVMVDYLQLIPGDAEIENRNLQIAAITRQLKGLAKELDVPVILLSQLNRSNEMRKDKRPMLSELRDSGAIEQDADLVVFIHRDEVYKATEDNKGKAEFIVGKQRNGPIGTVPVLWIAEQTRFTDAASADSV